MMDFTVEYVNACALHKRSTDTSEDKTVPVVRLAEVEKLIAELEWAMELISETYLSKDGVERARAFLDDLAAWRTGQEDKK